MLNNSVQTTAEKSTVLLTSSQKRKYEREMALKVMLQDKNKDLINEEMLRVIKNLELQNKYLKEDNDFYKLEAAELIEKRKGEESDAKVFCVRLPLITYNECNTMILSKNKKTFHNSEAYEKYKRNLWEQFETKYGEELRKVFPTAKEENKYVKIVCNMHVNNMNKDTDNIEKPFLDTLFNWLNKGINQNGKKLYSDNQVLIKQSSKVRNSGSVMQDEEIYFQVIPINEKIEKCDDMVYRFIRHVLTEKK